jgi:chromosome segregation ATPase
LFLLDTTEPQTPSRENSQHTTESGTPDSSKSFHVTLERQQSSPKLAQNSSEMESLKRKLTSTRRPETANRNLLPELRQYRQNNVALQKQIELLMAKLNESKQSERAMRKSLDEMTRQCNDWQEKVEEASRAEKSAKALQNTIDHLENRLEIANIERLDAEEQLFLIQAQKTPFDFHLPGLQAPPAVSQGSVKVSKTSAKHLPAPLLSPQCFLQNQV